MFGWIPVVGPIIEGIVSIFNKSMDTSVSKQVDNNKTDLGVIQARTSLAIAMKDNIGTNIMRDIIMYPVGVWVLLKFWYLCFHNILPEYTWIVLDPPETLQFIPYAVIAYLFVTAWRK